MQPVIAFVVREQVENAAFFFWAQRDTLAAEDPDTDTIASSMAGLRRILTLAHRRQRCLALHHHRLRDLSRKGRAVRDDASRIETGDAKRLEQAVGFACVATDGARALRRFEWLPPSVTAPVVRIWIDSGDRIRTEAALAAIIAHGGQSRRPV